MSAALKAQGFDVNLSPVADVWSGGNPFMRDRSYGGDPAQVAADVTAAVDGVHGAGLLSAAKHFPGHGSADGNSHYLLPAVTEDAATLEARDWPPFRAAAAAGADFMMVAHLNVPALDSSQPTYAYGSRNSRRSPSEVSTAAGASAAAKASTARSIALAETPGGRTAVVGSPP